MKLSLKYLCYGCRNKFLQLISFIRNLFCAAKYKFYIHKDNADIHDLKNTLEHKTLVLLNHFGGGVEKYIREHFSRSGYCHLTQCNYLNGFCYSLHDIENNRRLYFKSSELFSVLSFFYRITVNSLVGFTDEYKILDLLANKKKNSKETHLVYLVHDFHSVCPSVHLYYSDCYCNMRCQECGNEHYRKIIVDRQKKWLQFLMACDEIRTFSMSSKILMIKQYGNEINDNTTVVPHDMSYCNFKPLTIIKTSSTKIAIVGTIMSVVKGKVVVRNFLKFCANKNVEIFVVGLLSNECKIEADNIHYLGKYRQDNLDKILQQYNINVVFFPSVLPETFSYLVHELMMMQMPIVGFDIGAQGEYLASYKYGLTLPVNSPIEDIYNALIAISNNESITNNLYPQR